MDYEKIKKAQKLARRFRKLIADAEAEGLQFVVVDDHVSIGDSNITASWDSLIGEYKLDDFISVDANVPCLGA